MRVGGRLSQSELPYDQKHPIILPSKHPLTKLIIRYEHIKHLHAGTQTLLAIIRLKYWPILGRNSVKRVIHNCIKCFRVKPVDTNNIMGNLPTARLTPAKPFNSCGVDYAGPIQIKTSNLRNYKIVKAYICIFVCFCTRAIHIELVNDLTTESFINALKRFISRRGKPSEIFSDNGTNFVGARNELLRLTSGSGYQQRILEFTASDQINWNFIPPKAPHFGGLWEASVKSTKYHLKRILGNALLTFEELYTVLTQIEAILNSRPLTPMTDDPFDLNPLTPGHFLIGDALVASPQANVLDVPYNRLTRFNRLQQLTQQFWNRWTKEYLCKLQIRTKWKFAKENGIKIGTMVIVKEDNLPNVQKWQMGRIVELHPGADNVLRVVSVRVGSGIVKRSITKICVLPLETDN